uniref:Uncharacterized protein n=1 Tax=Salvator merianae TaxID=96440 RepID=A0A8D0E3H5_SALMN
WKRRRAIMNIFLFFQNANEYIECGLSKSYSASSNTLGIDLWRGRRCCSGNLLLPPLSQRQSEKSRTPDRGNISRPTTLPLLNLPIILVCDHCFCLKILPVIYIIFKENPNFFTALCQSW